MMRYSGDNLQSFFQSSKPSLTNNPYPNKDIRSIQQPPFQIQTKYQTEYPVLLSASMASAILVSDDTNYVSYASDQPFKHDVKGWFQKLPGFQFSKYSFSSTLLVSKETFSSLFPLHSNTNNRLIIKLHENLSNREYAYVVDSTRSL